MAVNWERILVDVQGRRWRHLCVEKGEEKRKQSLPWDWDSEARGGLDIVLGKSELRGVLMIA